jgi:hypothetical protein
MPAMTAAGGRRGGFYQIEKLDGCVFGFAS